MELLGLFLFPIAIIIIGVILFAFYYFPLSLPFIIPSLLVLIIAILSYIIYNFILDKVKLILRK